MLSRVFGITSRKSIQVSSHGRTERVGWSHGFAGILLACLGLIGWSSTPAWSQSAAAEVQISQPSSDVQYNRDVRPILADLCFSCHGPDSASRQVDLRLDQRDAALEHRAIEVGDPGASEMIRRILSTDPETVMPPPETKKKVSAAQRETLERWIAAGAEYQPHWSFLPPQAGPLPTVSRPEWCRQELDFHVLAGLDAAGLEPAPEADRHTLARRAALDLTGLPPTPEQVAEFVNDTSPNAYEAYLDRLLASRAWGEHRGRYWLDYARYADTHGIHFDNYREMWSYRDWVINAFNRNQPFDQFTLEQLAGDLIPGASLDQQLASGFNRCNITTNEGGVIGEEYLVLYTRDRTETTSQVWLGLTTGCAVCHDHKFDPVSQKEFYSLAAFFNNTTQGAMDGNVHNTAPIVNVPLELDRPRYAQLPGELAAKRVAISERERVAQTDFQTWLTTAIPADLNHLIPGDKLEFLLPLSEGAGASVTAQIAGTPRALVLPADLKWSAGKLAQSAVTISPEDQLVWPEVGDLEADQPFSVATWVKLGQPGSLGAIAARMENTTAYRGWDLWVEGDRVGMHLIDAWPDNALKVVAKQPLPQDQWTHVLVSYDGSRKASGVQVYYNGQLQPVDVQTDRLTGSLRTSVPFRLGQRDSSDRLPNPSLQDVRLYHRVLTAAEASQLALITRMQELLGQPAAERTQAAQTELFNWYLKTLDQPSAQLQGELAALTAEEAAILARGTIGHIMQESTAPAMAYVLARGAYDQRTTPVTPDTPAVLPPFPPQAPRNRLGFAQWLLSDEHPLTARVTVNRFWQEIFGTGLVRSSGDFGISGDLPSHPELLDRLAIDFRTHGWDVKRLFKQILLSSTYRQAASLTAQKRDRDPQNRLLSRGPRFRLEGEMIRDYALSVSGLLSAKVGGPSVKPYQPPGVWEAVAMDVSNTRNYQRDTGENLYRRSLYIFWKRSAPPAILEVFNAPSREVCNIRRERTNTPLQALATLNDEQYIEAARFLAQRVLLAPVAGEEAAIEQFRLEKLLSLTLARPIQPAEVTVLVNSLAELKAHFAAHPVEAEALLAVGEKPRDASLNAVDHAAWTMLANELLNLDESLVK